MRIETKDGRQGPLTFVTVSHTLRHGSTVCVEEEQDLVYREHPRSTGSGPAETPPEKRAPSRDARHLAPDTVMLFRYSSLTSNGHRIHYDQRYARDVEGYRNLVVHGPLTATLLMGHAASVAGAKLQTFEFRGRQPLFVDEQLTLDVVERDADRMVVSAESKASQGMTGTATFETKP